MKRSQLVLALFLSLLPLTAHALSLEEGLKIITETGRDVQIARSDEDVARGAVSLARSPWRPWVDLYGRETWLRYTPEAKFGPQTVTTSQDQFLAYGVRATQLLYDFGKSSSSIDAAQYGLKAREIMTGRSKNQAALDFIIAYLDLLESEKLLTVATEEVKRYEAHKKDTEARYRAGVITKNEVLQVNVTLADSQQRLLTAENSRSLRESKINSLLLKPLNDAVQPEELKASPAAGLTLDEAWAGAGDSRAVLKEMDAAIAAKEQSIQSTQAEYFPTFYVSGGYEYLENKYLVHQDNWSAIVGVNINLFSGGASSSKIGMARAELRSLKLSRDKLLDTIRLEVKGAYLDLQSSEKKMEVTKTAVEQAEENLRLQRLRYKEGVGTATEVLDAVTLLTTAESNSWKSLYGFKRAEAVLLNAAGRDLVVVYGK
ncbi:MAG: TolC family protein [Nitrospirae bacterium]|nr:TolC family protein [Nitrospirota bacterium]